MTVLIGVALLVAVVVLALLLITGGEENRRTISRFVAIIPIFAVLGIVLIALGIRLAFQRVCAACGSPLQPLADLVFAVADGPAVIGALSRGDYAALSGFSRLPGILVGSIVVESQACEGCGKAGRVRAYRAGSDRPSHEEVVRDRDAPGLELKSLASARSAS
ncbi:hypothetical protein ACEXQE_07345 [Herbiconiux sp. P17]|uniref:hypothetical protein n=1 Tax=Herbiconiux wuyangfengii TaxID=3342794 RepID=UPI0035B88EF6